MFVTFGIQKIHTSLHKTQSDCLVERFNQTIQQLLVSYVNESRNDWDDHLPYLCIACRSTVHESTKFSPNKLMLRREINLPLDVMVGSGGYWVRRMRQSPQAPLFLFCSFSLSLFFNNLFFFVFFYCICFTSKRFVSVYVLKFLINIYVNFF